jgi:hypothetical protein
MNPGFSSGAEGIRAHDLRRAEGKEHVLIRPYASEIFGILQTFCRTAGGLLFAIYWSVSILLEYSSTMQASRGCLNMLWKARPCPSMRSRRSFR